MPNARPCQGASNTSSPFRRGSAAAPLMAVTSAPTLTLTTGSWPDRSDHRVARDELRKLVLGQPLGASGALGEHHVARLRTRVPYPDLDRLRQIEPHLPEQRAGLAHH